MKLEGFIGEHPICFWIGVAVLICWIVSAFLIPFRISDIKSCLERIEGILKNMEGEVRINRNSLEKNQDVMMLLIETIRAKNNKGKG